MAPKKVARASDSVIRKPNRITIEKKKEIIAKHENGVRVSNLATQFGLAKSTICTILKNKEAIKAADVAKGVTVLTKQRPQIIEKVEKLLLVWIHEKELAGDSISEAIICKKAKKLHSDLVAETPSTSGVECEDFKASRGWFEKFRKRSGIHIAVRHGEAASSNKKAAEEFADEFEKFVESESYIPYQYFSCDETGKKYQEEPTSPKRRRHFLDTSLPNTTPLLQPMDQQIISNFNKLYIKALFSRCFQVTNDTNLTRRDFWKEHFDIFNCINTIDKAWSEVSYHTLQSSWKQLWSTCVPERDFEGFGNEEVEVKVVDEIVSMGKSIGLEVNSEDVEDHSEELTTEELVELQSDQVNAIQEEHLSEKDEDREEVSVAKINEICGKWNEVQAFIEKHHPNKTVTNRAVNIVNDNVMSHFWKILQKSQRQISLDQFLVPKSELPSVVMEVNSSSK